MISPATIDRLREQGLAVPSEPLMFQAWGDCLMWAIGNNEIIEQFRAETGNTWKPSIIPINRMIDEATGVDKKFIAEFIEWLTLNIWGTDAL